MRLRTTSPFLAILVLPLLVFSDSSPSSGAASRIFDLLANFSEGSPECSERAQHIFNKFMTDPAVLFSFLHSGKGLNDLGDHTGCNGDNGSRYILLQINGLMANLALGICGPKECAEKDYYGLKTPIATALNNALRGNGPSPLFRNFNASDIVFADPVERRNGLKPYTDTFYCAMGYLALICFLNLLAGLVSAIRENAQNGTCMRLVSCFDFTRNLRAIFSVPEKQETDLKIFDGIRVLSMLWVMLGHAFYYSKHGYVTNIFESMKFLTTFKYSYILNATFSVDIFFFLSGFLAAYLLVVQLKSPNGKISFLKLYVHRIFRILPLCIVAMIILCFLIPLAGSGPGFHNYVEKIERDCGAYWYWNILFINNFTPGDADCGGHMWYIANDMQFFMLSPILVYVYHKRRSWGYALVGVLALLCVVIGIVLCFKYDLSASYMKFNSDYFEYYYHRPYNRISPYLVGVLAAYLYYEYKTSLPEAQHGVFARASEKIKTSTCFRYVIYLVCASGMFWLVHAIYWLDKYPQDWQGWPDVLYLIFSKPLFVFFLFGLVYPSMLGHGGMLRSILAHDCFLPFARVTFGAYLIHPLLMTYMNFDEQKGGYFEHNVLIIKFFGYAVVSYFVSTILSAAFESPILGLDKEFLKPRVLTKKAKETEATPEWAKVPENDMELEKLAVVGQGHGADGEKKGSGQAQGEYL